MRVTTGSYNDQLYFGSDAYRAARDRIRKSGNYSASYDDDSDDESFEDLHTAFGSPSPISGKNMRMLSRSRSADSTIHEPGILMTDQRDQIASPTLGDSVTPNFDAFFPSASHPSGLIHRMTSLGDDLSDDDDVSEHLASRPSSTQLNEVSYNASRNKTNFMENGERGAAQLIIDELRESQHVAYSLQEVDGSLHVLDRLGDKNYYSRAGSIEVSVENISNAFLSKCYVNDLQESNHLPFITPLDLGESLHSLTSHVNNKPYINPLDLDSSFHHTYGGLQHGNNIDESLHESLHSLARVDNKKGVSIKIKKSIDIFSKMLCSNTDQLQESMRVPYDMKLADLNNSLHSITRTRRGNPSIDENEIDRDTHSSSSHKYEKSAPSGMILSRSAFCSLIDNALPLSVKHSTWIRVYSLTEHGDSFDEMIRRVQNHLQTVLVVETTQGDVLGGFAASPWSSEANQGWDMFSNNSGGSFSSRSTCSADEPQMFSSDITPPPTPRRRGGEKSPSSTNTNIPHDGSFYGNGQSFIFSVKNPGVNGLPTKNGNEEVNVYRWTGKNECIQSCNLSKQQLSMGGGGLNADFGLSISENLTRGTSGRCETFDNEILSSEPTFDIVNMEVFAFCNGWLM